MKKALVILLMLLLAGCGKAAPAESTPPPSTPEPVEPAPPSTVEISEPKADICPAVNVDGVVYFDTGLKNDQVSCIMAGEITSQCEGWELPSLPNQSNFGTGFQYQMGPHKDCVTVDLGDEWRIFATEVQKNILLHPDTALLRGTVVEVTDSTMLVQGYPEDEDCDCLGPVVAVPLDGITPIPNIKDIVEIAYDGIIKECEPGELGQIYSITVFYSKIECGIDPDTTGETDYPS